VHAASLSPLDLAVAAGLVLLLAGSAAHLHLGIARSLLIAAARTAVQLLLIGLVLKALFAHVHLAWMTLVVGAMLLAAGWEVVARQARGFAAGFGFLLGTTAMFVSSFSVTVLALTAIIQAHPWYTPQYAIPLLGMLLGNTMNGVALGLDRLTQSVWRERASIEGRLLMGQRWSDAVADIRRDSLRAGLIPIVNAMAAAGIVSLPGMMTGQILAGAPPVEAVKYQILVMFLIAAGTGFGTLAAVWMGSARLFDHRHRLRMERLRVRA
jgi:putative ABC transport system permease protein